MPWGGQGPDCRWLAMGSQEQIRNEGHGSSHGPDSNSVDQKINAHAGALVEMEGREVRSSPRCRDNLGPGPGGSRATLPSPVLRLVVLAPSGWPPASLTAPLPPRGLEVPPQGWSVSLHSTDTWQDLAGCDFVLDLISQTEDLGDPAAPHSYPITPLGS